MQRFRLILSLGLLIATSGIVTGIAQAYAPENELLEVKGYSPALIDTISRQRSKQEWRQAPAPRRTPVENALHNIYNNDWTGSFDEFGSRIIRE